MSESRPPTSPASGAGAPARSAPARMRRALSYRRGEIRIGGDPAAASTLRAAFEAAHDGEERDLTHGFHSYPARFHPLLVRTLLAAHATPGAIICDPFCGSGTTLVETLVAGCRGAGSDLNPLALELSRVKALAPTLPHRKLPDELVLRAAELATESMRRVKERTRTKTNGEAWDDARMYAPHVFRELVGLRELFDEPPGGPLGALSRRALLLCFSAILVKVSRQPSDTAAGVQERTIGKGLPTRLFRNKAEELAKGLRELHARVPEGTPSPTIHKADARKLRHLSDGSVDLIITSPPYLGTYDYAAHHTRRLGWLGLDIGSLQHGEIGTRRRAPTETPAAAVSAWQGELDDVAAAFARVLRPGGSAFVVLGDSHIGGLAVPGDRAMRTAAERAGLTILASAAEGREAPGSRGQARRSEEHLLHLQRR